MDNRKCPKLRFPQFTDTWEQRKLRDTKTFFTDGNYGEAYPKASDMTDSSDGIPFLTGGNLKCGKLDITGASYIKKEKHEKLISGHLIEDDIVIAVRGSLGALGYVNKGNVGWNINSQLAILRTDKSELYGKYLLQFLISGVGQNEMLKRQTGSALKQLPIGAIKDVTVPITSIAEQQKIGEFFYHIDNLITLHQRKLDIIKEYKTGMLHKMFPKEGELIPEIRFPGFTDAWEQRKLGDIAERVQGNDGRMELPTLTISAANGWMNQVDRFSGNIAGKEQKNYTLLHKGELSYNHGNSKLAKYGTVFSLESYEEALVPRVYHSFKMTDGDSGFIEYLFETKIPDKELSKLISSGARMDGLLNIGFEDFMGINIVVPSLSEQRKISYYFRELDNLITLHQRKLDEIKEYKQGLLQQMFV